MLDFFLYICYFIKVRLHLALMVKRLRRRPLTAESRVRFPMGVPNKNLTICQIFLVKNKEKYYVYFFTKTFCFKKINYVLT